MKHFKKALFCIAVCVFLSQSCVDKDYDWDNIDKNGVLSIPPVMFGNIDTIYIEGLPETIIPGGIPLPDGSIGKREVINGLFDGDAIKNFFFEGAGAVEIKAKADLDFAITGITVDIYFSVLDYADNRIEEVVIPAQSLTIGKDQDVDIIIDTQYMAYMENAVDLELTIVISSQHGSVWIGENDYLFLKEIIVKTGGFHFEL